MTGCKLSFFPLHLVKTTILAFGMRFQQMLLWDDSNLPTGMHCVTLIISNLNDTKQ